ncbi:tyrosine-type recombinase/integrase [Halomonas elongata]|uniref:tyrosine-type recombinase/integrase n=1 Tax=Halomonas elongata TaxID=2746 RepID=UPI00255AD119|nr:tyrosine-type recombinase/integrase [Halomonas elongata]MDL4862067.1 tyrosine-type recombinase/integrase [Halomonas elongata]
MKRTAIKRRPLADTVLSSLEPEAREYRESYGVDRLYFVVSPSGRKRWEVRYKHPATGKWTWLGVGAYPDTKAKAARAAASEVASLVADGIDPVEVRRGKPSVRTFGMVAEEWYRYKEAQGRAERTLTKIRYWLDNDALPALGETDITGVSRGDCVEVQRAIEARGAYNIAEKSRAFLRRIFDFAIAHDYCENNPASNLAEIAAPPPKVKPRPHLLEDELPEFLRSLRKTGSRHSTRVAAWMVLWTASRPGTVRWMEWSEINGDLWHIPAEKMKMRRGHTVPLPRQALEALEEVRPRTGRFRYVFAGEGAKLPVISDAAINRCFDKAGYKERMTGHGARHTAKTLLSEHGWPLAWTEMQLAHKPQGLEGTYNQASYIKHRREMMQWYADYLQALEEGMTDDMRREFSRRARAAVS